MYNIIEYNEEVYDLQSVVYLDNSSTTKPCRKAVENINRALTENWGNPSSLHALGMNAELEISDTRAAAAKILRCKPEEIIFTAGGTESNNTAILGAAQKNAKRGKRIVTTSIEHPSVLETVKRLEPQGFEIAYLHPDKSGSIPLSDIENAITSDTVLVSMMLVNNETGAIQPVRETADILRRKNPAALMHCDAVQAFGKLPFTADSIGADLISVSGHKIHGPKGTGLLYIRKGVHIPPLLTGGGQEGGMRSSTEAVPLIAGLRGALEELPDVKKQLEKQRELWSYAVERLTASGFAHINSYENGLPYILNASIPGYRSETLLHFLESKNIFVSSGSACAKGEGSYVLKEGGLERALVDSALRISFSRENTREDVDRLIEALTAATQKLRKA